MLLLNSDTTSAGGGDTHHLAYHSKAGGDGPRQVLTGPGGGRGGEFGEGMSTTYRGTNWLSSCLHTLILKAML